MLFKRLKARSLCVIFEMTAMAFLGGVAGFFGGGVGDMVLGAILGVAIGGVVWIALVVRYALEPEAQGDSVPQVSYEHLERDSTRLTFC